MKAVRELGSERRETVRSISGVSGRALRGAFHSTRGPGRTHRWCTSSSNKGTRWVAKCGEDNCWKHLSRKPTPRWVLSRGHGKRSRLIGVKCKTSNGFSWDILTDRLALICLHRCVSCVFFALYSKSAKKTQETHLCKFKIKLLLIFLVNWVFLFFFSIKRLNLLKILKTY